MSLENTSDIRNIIAAVAGPREWSDTRESWLARAARRANVSYRAAKSLWYGEITDPEHKATRRMAKAAHVQAGEEATGLAKQFDNLAGSLNAADAALHRTEITALVDAARALRGLAERLNTER